MPESLHGSTKHCNTSTSKDDKDTTDGGWNEDALTVGYEEYKAQIRGLVASDDVIDKVALVIECLDKQGKNRFQNHEEAMAACEEFHISGMPIEFGDESFIHEGMGLGYRLQWNDLLKVLEIKPPKGRHGSGEWQAVLGGEEGTAPLRSMRNHIRRCVAVFGQIKEKGELVGFRLAKMSPTAWGATGKALYGACTGCIGTELVPIVNPLTGWVNEQVSYVKSLGESEKEDLLADLKNAFLEVPGIKPSGAHNEALASHGGEYFYTMLGHRALQYHPDFKDRPIRVQREVPTLVGPRSIGKSTLTRNLLPPDTPSGYGRVEIDLLDEPNKIYRKMAGNAVFVFDDMDSLKSRNAKAGQVKSIITKDAFTFDRKYLNEQTVVMPGVSIASANALDLPDDDAGAMRFVPIVVERDREDEGKGLSGEELAIRAIKHLRKKSLDWFMAGLIRAIENVPMEITGRLAAFQCRSLGESASDHEGVHAVVAEMVNSGAYEDTTGMPAIAMCQVAHRMGWLRCPSSCVPPYSRGEVLDPDDNTIDLKTLQLAWAPDSSTPSSQRRVHQVKTAMRYLGWSDTGSRGRRTLTDGNTKIRAKAFAPVERVD